MSENEKMYGNECFSCFLSIGTWKLAPILSIKIVSEFMNYDQYNFPITYENKKA